MKPSDFPRDIRFQTPGPAFIEDGVAHLRSYEDVKRVMLDEEEREFSQDYSYWLPEGQRIHLSWYFMWATGKTKADGTPGRNDVLRGIVEPWFRTKAVHTMKDHIQRNARMLIEKIIQKGTGQFNLATELAYRYSIRNICSLVGLPIEREDWMRDQLEEFARTPAFDQIKKEPQEIEDYFWEVIYEREKNPKDELLDVLISAWRNKQITDLELLGYIWGTFSAGTDTTGVNIVNTFSLLGEFHLLDEARANINNNDWLQKAGEEVLRFGTPFVAGPSLAVTDVELASGLKIPAKTQVRVWFCAANRDKKVNGNNAHAADPNVFDITRWPNHHMSFGLGAHYCLGAQLARLETRILLQMALKYLPDLTFDESKPFERYAGLVDGVKQAHFSFDQQKAEQLLPELQMVGS